MSLTWELEIETIHRRMYLDIWLEILEQCRSPSRKTRIVYQCNLNFKIAKIHLDRLIEKNLIEQREHLFKTTEKGVEWIDKMRAIDFY